MYLVVQRAVIDSPYGGRLKFTRLWPLLLQAIVIFLNRETLNREVHILSRDNSARRLQESQIHREMRAKLARDAFSGAMLTLLETNHPETVIAILKMELTNLLYE